MCGAMKSPNIDTCFRLRAKYNLTTTDTTDILLVGEKVNISFFIDLAINKF